MKSKLTASEWIELAALKGEANIVADQHFGLINGALTTNVPHSRVLAISSLYAPPFASSNFILEGRIFGERPLTSGYTWLPFLLERRGELQDIGVSSRTTLIEEQRSMILEVEFYNKSPIARTLPVQFEVSGGLDYVTAWDFTRPVGDKVCSIHGENSLLTFFNDTGAIVLGGCSMRWEAFSSHWRTEVSLMPQERRKIFIVIAVGEQVAAEGLVRQLLENPEEVVRNSTEFWGRRTVEVLKDLPRFEAECPRLKSFYYRSALHFVLNRWNVNEFFLEPYYSTGSIMGGCVCSYLWDFSGGWEIFPLVDPKSTRAHIKAFLSIDLTRHFAFNPLSGAGWGPWYSINQEKIVFLIYYYVHFTGDEAFLKERVCGKTVLDWVIYHALFGDRMEEEANLIDYGAGNHHLELRREYRYDHYLPDLNARRYQTYLAADALCQLSGQVEIDFRDRAEMLKSLIRRELWSDEHQWWFHKDPEGRKNLRYTLQLFKLIGSPVFDKEEEALVAHLNEDEFLSEFGLHSMSKQDPAYDQIDIDNGGGGACSCFTPQIIERLYKAGYADKAGDLLHRILWWGDRLPYWSDSLVANVMDYRRDTPLQNAVGAVCGAQSIIFGMFGIRVESDGRIVINPVPPSFSPSISIAGVKLRGHSIDVEVRDGLYEVRAGEDVYHGKVGESISFVATGEGLLNQINQPSDV